MEQIFELKEPKGKISCPEDIFKKIKRFRIDYKQENFIVVFMNVKGQIIKIECLFKGAVDGCLIDPRTIFRRALYNNASKIIISHNHPSGDLTPSYEDNDIYRKLREAGEMLQIKVIDNIIFNKKEYYSAVND